MSAPASREHSSSNVKRILQQAVSALRAAGILNPHLDAELLLAHCLQVDRSALLAHPEWQLDEAQQTAFARLLARRLQRQPLAYLLGQRWFYGLEFYVNEHVLIPRPETELLVESGLAWLQAHASPGDIVVDVGTGSGAIAVTLAVHCSVDVRILGADISAPALRVAQRNARAHGVAERIRWIQADLLQPLAGPLHLVVANLPYIATPDRDDLMPEVRDYEPEQALFAGPEGLTLITRCLQQARTRLAAGGAVFLEIGYQQGADVRRLARKLFPQAKVQVHADLAGLERMVSIET